MYLEPPSTHKNDELYLINLVLYLFPVFLSYLEGLGIRHTQINKYILYITMKY